MRPMRRKLIAAAILGIVIAMVAVSCRRTGTPVRKVSEPTLVAIQLPPPPPPPLPPPPPKVQPPPEEKMEEEAFVQKPEDMPEKPKTDEAPALGTGIKGNGPPDGFGLGSSGNGGGRFGSGSGRSSKYGAYAYRVQSKVSNLMRANPKTRNASFSGEVRIWADSTGQITRSKFVGSASNPSISNAIKSDVLAGQRLDEPPPLGMKMPIVMRVNAQRPR